MRATVKRLVQATYDAGHVPVTVDVKTDSDRMILVVNVRTRFAANCGLNPKLEAYCNQNNVGVMAEFRSSNPR